MRLPFLKIVLSAIAALLLAGIVHLSSIVLLPSLAAGHGAARLASQMPFNQFVAAQAKGNRSSAVPFEDATAETRVCRYSLAEGPVRVDVPIGEGFLSLAVIQSDGRILSSMIDKVAQRRVISAVVGRPDQIAALEADDPDDDVPSDLRLASDTVEGVILVRAIVARASFASATRDLVAQARCGSMKP
jgi:uncharacterized membrane protein